MKETRGLTRVTGESNSNTGQVDSDTLRPISSANSQEAYPLAPLPKRNTWNAPD